MPADAGTAAEPHSVGLRRFFYDIGKTLSLTVIFYKKMILWVDDGDSFYIEYCKQ